LRAECKSTLEHIKVLEAECKSKSDDKSEPDIIGDIVKTLREEHKSAVHDDVLAVLDWVSQNFMYCRGCN